MSGPLGLLVIGFVLIVLLVFVLRRSVLLSDRPPAPEPGVLSLDSLQFEDRRENILDRIFGQEDWDFVLCHASSEIQGLFLNERKKLALFWVSEVRSQAKAAIRIHVANARASEKLLPMAELKVAVDYLTIRAKCEFIAVVLMLLGPGALRRMAGQASHLSDNLRRLLELALTVQPSVDERRV